MKKLRTDPVADAVRTVVSTSAGRNLLAYIIDECAVLQASDMTNPLAMAYAEGRREVGRILIALIDESTPEGFWHLRHQIMGERENEYDKRKQRQRQRGSEADGTYADWARFDDDPGSGE